MSDFPATATKAGVTVTSAGEALLAARDSILSQAIAAGIPAGIVAKDATLWGPDATAEAAKRLGWLDCATVSRDLVPRIEALRAALLSEGVDHVVLAGMGGSSLAPEVICATYGAELTVLDTTDPAQVASALNDRLERTVVVVSSKSGGTLETDSHRRAFRAAFLAAGIDPAKRIVVVTDPGSPLENTARTEGVREIFLADPNVGGRYSALTAFGLVPSGLAGVPISTLLDDAAAVGPTLELTEDSPALWLGAALGGFGVAGHDKVVIADAGSGIVGFGDWAEQLIAESTGKSGRGLLPVVVESLQSPGFERRVDTHLIVLGGDPPEDGTAVSGPLGAQFLLWEFATAIAGWAFKIDPFNQPNVQESKDNTSKVLESAKDGELPADPPLSIDGVVEIHGGPVAEGITTVETAIDALLAAVPPHGYIAVMAYLDRLVDTDIAAIRDALARRTDAQVTFGWGPRFLHSTGQFHKGGPPVGAFLQITGESQVDVLIPDRPFGFKTLQLAQATGDSQAITSRERPFLRLHLTDRPAGIKAVIDAASGS